MNRNNVEHWRARIATDARRAASVAHKRPDTCRECDAVIDYHQMRKYGICEPCREKHIAAWKEARTRHPGDTRPRWLIGDACRVKLGKTTYDAVIIDMSDVSRADGNYDLVKLRITKTVQGLDGKPYTSTWVHPEPVQSYKLKKPLLKD